MTSNDHHHHTSHPSMSMPLFQSSNSIASAPATATTNGLPQQQQQQPVSSSFRSLTSTPRANSPSKALQSLSHSQQPAMSNFTSNGLSQLHNQHHHRQSASRNSSFTGYDGANGSGSMVPPHRQGDNNKPQIYRAVYSNISVYEMEVNGVAVMKRRSDSWLNATQILKVAGVVKARRTKTLEKDIAAGEHEKVQGGYGKYQGTWVNYQRGIELCREYHVEELLRPLLEYDMGVADGTGPGLNPLDTPTKEQAMAAQRKRLYNGVDSRGGSQLQQGTFFQNISRTAATAVNAMSKARFESPAARSTTDSRRSSMVRKSSHPMGSQESQAPFGSQQSTYTMGSDSGFGSSQQQQQQQHSAQYHTLDGSGLDFEDPVEPPRKRVRSSSNHGMPFQSHREHSNLSANDPTPTEPNESFCQDVEDSISIVDGHRRGLEALSPATMPDRFKKIRLIMTLFLDKRTKDFSGHPALMQLSSDDLEMPLDEYRNNALHWATMLARIPLVHALIEKGVNIFRLNGAGETALQKAVGTRNNLDYRSFPRLLQVLAPTVDMVDYNGRTVLHHIAVMAATGGGGHVSAKHYLEALLEFIVRHGGTSFGQQQTQTPNGLGSNNGYGGEIITLGRFISEIVNLRDDQGDTALNLAGRARSVLVPQLLEVGADPHIPNHTGLRPADYGVGVDMVNGNSHSEENGGREDSFIDQLARSKKEVLDTTLSQINTIVEEALGGIDRELTSDLVRKQEKFDHWHARIRESAKARQIEQKQLDDLKCRSSDRIEVGRRIRNLERSSEKLLGVLKEMHDGDESYSPSSLESGTMDDANADKNLGLDTTEYEALFPESFDPASSGSFSERQVEYLMSLPSPETLTQRINCYEEFNEKILSEVERYKSKNVVLGQNYRRMVMACTGWTAEQVDEAAEGLTQCVKELNDNPVPEDEAIEILMRDRGQDW